MPSVVGFSPITEVGNNIAIPTQGTAGTDLVRISPVAYSNGISSPSLATSPGPRVLSDILNNQADPSNPSQDLNTIDANNLTDFGYSWGQFIDHDMSKTTTNPNETLTILADPSDPIMMGDQTFSRSTYDLSTGTSTLNPRQQTNSITSYLDLSQVYGSTTALADALRTHVGGQMKTSPGNMLPYDNSTYFTSSQLALINMANDSRAVATQNLFVTGDVRGNENVELTALQTLFLRNHNLTASQRQQHHPDWSDETLYQEARKLNIAEYQQIVYNAYLPDLLGPSALTSYSSYNPNVNAAIATEFSTIAFRFGHSLLDSNIGRDGNNGLAAVPNDPAGAELDLATDFFDPNVLNPNGVTDPLTGHISTDIGPLLKAGADGVAQADDLLATSAVRNLLFGNPGVANNGLDVMARDVERARDNGIGSYNQVRIAYGLPAVTSFAQITSNVTVQNELKAAYGQTSGVDNVNLIDPFEGGLAEDHVPGSDMGPLFTKILVDQFTRLRDGDRFFYLNESLTPEEIGVIRQSNSLGKIIEANTNVTNLQDDVFVFNSSISGTINLNANGGAVGVTVQLKDNSGNLISTTISNVSGQYSFNQQNGVGPTGNYFVFLVVPTGMTQTSTNLSPILISNGNMNVTGVNFQLNGPTAPTITTNPSNQVVPGGSTATFTAAALSSTTVQWYVSADGGISWSAIAGAVSTTLTLTNLVQGQTGYKYEAVFTNSVGSVSTSAATLIVAIPLTDPVVGSHDTSSTISLNTLIPNPTGTVTFSATLHDPLADLKKQYGLTIKDGYFSYRGQNEKYLLSNNGSNPAGGGWFVLMPSGNLLAWNGSLATSPLVITLPKSVYDNPALLTTNMGVPIVTTGGNPLYDLKVKLGLVKMAFGFNYRGFNEYYLQSSNLSNSANGGYYVLLPNGTLLAWDGNSVATSPLAVDLSPYGNVYSNPTLLTNASLPTAVGVTALVNQSGGGSVTLTPIPGFDRTVQVTVTAIDSGHPTTPASQSFYFQVNDAPPSIPPVSNISATHGTATPSFNLNATDPGDATPLSYSVAVSNPLYDVKAQFGLGSQAVGFNYRGQLEWYFLSSNGSNPAGHGYYVLLPGNKLYAFNWADLPVSSKLSATLMGTPTDLSSFGNPYGNPALLSNTQPAAVVLLNRGPLFDIQAQFGLNTPAMAFNYRGQSEWYLISSNGSNLANGGYFALMPSGKLFAWDGVSINTTVTQPALADMSANGVYANPTLLTSAQPVFVGDLTSSWKAQFGLAIPVAYNYRGQNEWYFRSTNGSNPNGGGYYVLTPTGQLYAFNKTDGLSSLNNTFAGTLVATPGASAYNNPFDLGLVPAVTATVDGTGQVTLTPNLDFVGTVKITVMVSNGAEKTTPTFLFNVSNNAPTFTQTVSNFSTLGATHTTTVALTASDIDAGDSKLQFRATTTTLFDIRTRLGLNAPAGSFNVRGQNEYYFQSTNGSNYVLLSNGYLYAFNGADLNSYNLNATLRSAPVADLSGFGVYANPLLLANAMTDPSLIVSFTGSTLNLNWSTSLAVGTKFMVTAYVGDGAQETQQTFFVTLT